MFGVGSRAPIAITILVKNPNAAKRGRIYFHAVDDYMTRQGKLDEVRRNGSISNMEWQTITPDGHGDWLNLRDNSFNKFMAVRAGQDEQYIFNVTSNGVKTNRDIWTYNSSYHALEHGMSRSIDFYNKQMLLAAKDTNYQLESAPETIKWDETLERKCKSKVSAQYSKDNIRESLYRPFFMQYLYYDNLWIARPGHFSKMLPHNDNDNLIITVTGKSAKAFSCLMSNITTDHDSLEKSQCLPRYLYIRNDIFGFAGSGLQPFGQGVFDDDGITPSSSGLQRIDAISDNALRHFSEAYGREATADDLFFYIYGILHSEDYRTRYANNLMKELPRIPRVATYEQFAAFRDAGRALGNLHVNYENVQPYGGVKIIGEESGNYRVVKMKWRRIPGNTGNAGNDKTTLIYNDDITITDIPLEAQEYVVNKKSALDWVVERACVKTDNETGIVNDFNKWGEEHGNPKYPLELFLKVITVSLETMKIVRALPPLEIHPLDKAE